jgi:rubrerythrin
LRNKNDTLYRGTIAGELSISFEFNADEILEMAEQIERKGARFYRAGLKEMISQTSGRVRIEGIIKEEMGHIGFLNREIAALSSNVR